MHSHLVRYDTCLLNHRACNSGHGLVAMEYTIVYVHELSTSTRGQIVTLLTALLLSPRYHLFEGDLKGSCGKDVADPKAGDRSQAVSLGGYGPSRAR